MNILFLGQGVAPTISYFIIFVSVTLTLAARRRFWVAALIGAAFTAVIYASPCTAFIAFSMWFYAIWQKQMEYQQQPMNGGWEFRHNFHFADPQSIALHNGFSYTSGASTWDNPPAGTPPVSEEMKAAARRAVRIDPYRYRGDGIIVETRVTNERGRPVIYDYIVTNEQLERYHATGIWNTHKSITYNGEVLSAPTGLAAAFMDHINGPTLTKVRRR